MDTLTKQSNLQEIWRHKDLIKDFVKKDFIVRYAGSTLGSVWNVINPLVMIAIYTLVFSKIMKAKLPHFLEGTDAANYSYSVYLCTGLIPWGMFAESLIRSTNILIENGNLIKKVSFPSELLHISAIITSLINFMITFTFFVIFLCAINFFAGYPIHITLFHWIVFGVVVLLQQIFAIGLGYMFSVLNVFFRDVGQIVNIITQLWFWFTPIVYLEEIIPKRFAEFLYFNPMYYFTRAYHKILFAYEYPDKWLLLSIVIISFFTLVLGVSIYQKLKLEIADEL